MKNIIKKAAGILLAGAVMLSSALSAAASAETASKKTYSIKKRTVPVYSEWKDVTDGYNGTLYFVNDSDVPYVDLETILREDLYLRGVDKSATRETVLYDGSKAKLVLDDPENYVEFDFTKDTVTFSMYETFKTHTRFYVDYVGYEYVDRNGNPVYLNRSVDFARVNHEKVFDLSPYNIDLVRAGKYYLIPLQTYVDIFLLPYHSICYNGKALFKVYGGTSSFFSWDGSLTNYGKKFYNAETKGSFSKSTVRYAYNELCFMLDENYGNKESHKITSFDEYFKQTGLYDYLRSTDPKKVDEGLFLLVKYLDDVHTSYDSSSYASGDEYLYSLYDTYWYANETYKHYSMLYSNYYYADYFYPNGIPAYDEIGDTAFITFDMFTSVVETGSNYYRTKPDANAPDTAGIIGYSFSRIFRENSPVKKVVLDLSCNSGGTDSAAVYTLAAFLGKIEYCQKNDMTGTQETTFIEADTNFDGVFDERDYLADKGLKLYCLVSEATFSNGNAVASILKNSDQVTLIGRKTGGGAYNVLSVSTAYGSGLSISAPTSTGIMINSSFYGMDAGVEPDIYIVHFEHFYYRKRLVQFLNKIL